MGVGHVDLEPLEHDAVQLGAVLDAGAAVQLVGIIEVGEEPTRGLPALVDMDRGLGQSTFDARSFVAQLTDFLRQFGLRPVGIGGEVEVAVFMTVDFRQPDLEMSPVIVLATVVRARGLSKTVRKLLPQIGGQADGSVVIEHGCFNVSDTDEGQCAAAVLTAPTDVVEVQVSVLVLGSRDDEAAAAPLAGEYSLEIVVIAALAIAGTRHVSEHLLDSVEKLLADKRLMPALVFAAVPLDVAEVVAIAQHRLDGMTGDGPGGITTVGATAEASFRQQSLQLVVGVLAGGEPLEGHRDVRRALGVKGDRIDHAPLEMLADVEIAGWHPAGCAADDRLLRHLVLQVFTARRRLEAADREDDAKHHLAFRGAVVDVLGSR